MASRAVLLLGALSLLAASCGGSKAAPRAVAPVVSPSSTPSATASPTAPPSPLASAELAPFRQMMDAVNRGDVAGAVAALADDVVWERGGQCPPGTCRGKPAAAGELARDIEAHHRLTPLSVDTVDGMPRVRLELRNDGTQRGGVERVIQFFKLELRGGKIAAVRVSFDTSDPVTAGFVGANAGQQRPR